MNNLRILLIGCGGSAGFNFVESLRMASDKYTIIGTDINIEHLELSNCDIKYLVPRNSDPNYPGVISSIIEKENIDFVHLQPDSEVAFWSVNRHLLNAPFMLPSKQAIELCHNKINFANAMNSAGVPVPRSIHVTDEASIGEIFNSLNKTSEKVWVRAIRGAGSRASLPVTKAEHAHMWIDYWNTVRGTEYSDFMMAEFLPGREFAFQSIWKDGLLITSMARERKEYVFGSIMPSGQSSSPSVAVTVHNESVNDVSTRAIEAADKSPNGIYCVDLKEDLSGSPCVMEINIGRFFTTNDFFSSAGNNMPDYFVKLAMNEEVPDLKKYNSVPEGINWLRIIDMGKKMVGDGEWNYRQI